MVYEINKGNAMLGLFFHFGCASKTWSGVCYTEGYPGLRIVTDLSALLYEVRRCLMIGKNFRGG
jgi:hypothetical protein